MDVNGRQVWGPAAGQGYTFNHFDGGPRVNRLTGGVVVIDYSPQASNEPTKPGERLLVEYIGYLENGKVFDSSSERGRPFAYSKGDRIIEGWALGMADATRGTTRRIIIPAAMAHGPKTADGLVPPNSTLILDVKVVDVAPAAATPVRPGIEPIKMDPNDPVYKKMQEDIQRRMEEKRKRQQEAEQNPKGTKPVDPATPTPPK
jgi:peptidylprolyl isomerase